MLSRQRLGHREEAEKFYRDSAAVPGSHLDYVLAPLQGRLDGWFPRGDVSIIAGASEAGKTTFGIDLLQAQRILAILALIVATGWLLIV